MDERSDRFALPFIVPGQAQKEVFHNEALALLDAALHPCVEGVRNTSPPELVAGTGYIVGADPQGAFSGRAHALAVLTAAGWRFVQPVVGMAVWSKEAGHPLHWTGNDWSGAVPCSEIRIGGKRVVGSQGVAVPSPSGGSTIDQEARAAINLLIATFKSHGLTE